MPPCIVHQPLSAFDDHSRYVGESAGVATEADVTVSASATDNTEVVFIAADVLLNFCFLTTLARSCVKDGS